MANATLIPLSPIGVDAVISNSLLQPCCEKSIVASAADAAKMPAASIKEESKSFFILNDF